MKKCSLLSILLLSGMSFTSVNADIINDINAILQNIKNQVCENGQVKQDLIKNSLEYTKEQYAAFKQYFPDGSFAALKKGFSEAHAHVDALIALKPHLEALSNNDNLSENDKKNLQNVLVVIDAIKPQAQAIHDIISAVETHVSGDVINLQSLIDSIKPKDLQQSVETAETTWNQSQDQLDQQIKAAFKYLAELDFSVVSAHMQDESLKAEAQKYFEEAKKFALEHQDDAAKKIKDFFPEAIRYAHKLVNFAAFVKDKIALFDLYYPLIQMLNIPDEVRLLSPNNRQNLTLKELFETFDKFTTDDHIEKIIKGASGLSDALNDACKL